MKRIDDERFVIGDWGEDAYVVSIENGEPRMMAWIEEWPDAPEYAKEGYRIAYSNIEMNIDLVFNGDGSFFDSTLYSDEYEKANIYYCYEKEEEQNNYESVYDCLLGYSQPYNGRWSDKNADDYDIFLMTKDEFQYCFDAFRDGYYVFIIEE